MKSLISRGSIHLLIVTLVLALGALPAVAARDEAAIGRIIALRGSALAIAADGSRRSLAQAATIGRGELVRTADRCRLQILFRDNTIISLGPHSELVVEEYQWDGSNAPAKMKSVIREGVFRVLGGSITRSAPENFTTETPSATIGIRGSMYAGTVRNGVLQVVFQGGKGIFVRNPVRNVEISTPGFGTRVASREVAPVEPYRVPAAELDKLDPLRASAPEPPQAGSRPAADQAPESEPPTTAQAGSGTDASAAPPAASEPAAADAATAAAAPAPAPDPALTTATPTDPALTDPTLVDPTLTTPTPTDATLTDLGSVTTTTGQASSGVNDTLLQNQVSGSTTTTTPTAPTTTTPAPIVSPPLSGRFLAVQDDLVLTSTTDDVVWAGTLNGTSTDGVLSSQATTGQGTLVVDPLPVATYDASLAYAGETKLGGQTRSVSLLGSSLTFTSLAVGSDTGGEFCVFALDDLFHTPSYAYRELGFAGVPSTVLPTAGIDSYRGPLLLTLKNLTGPDFESFSYALEAWVNWHDGKVMGAIRTPSLNPAKPDEVSGFFFGDVSGGSLANVRFIGMDVAGPDPVPGPGTMPLTIGGTASFSQFYGSQTQGLGLVAGGNTYDVMNQTTQEDWQFTAAGFRQAGMTQVAKTGSATWQGFAVGIGDDMTAPDVNRRIFMNTVPSDFSLNVDRDAGTFSGTLNAVDQATATVLLSGVPIGGSNGSVYIDDKLVAARIGSTATVINGASSGNLKGWGNYLICEDPATPLASYLTWGSWEIAYDDPSTFKPYHVHNPGSLWVAGERTPVTEVQSLVSSNFSATYKGGAAGVLIPASGSFMRLDNGTSNLLIDFSPAASFPVSGSLDFTVPDINNNPVPVSLNVYSSPGSLTTSGFSGQISPAIQSTLQGAFYGPGAASVGGSFDALMSTGERYTGVFGGDR